MTLALRLSSVVLFAASAAAGPAFAQTLPPGAMPGSVEAIGGSGIAADPFAGGAYAVPVGAPVAIAYGGPATTSPGTVISGPTISAPPSTSGPVYMAPQVIGGTMPSDPNCNCPSGTFGTPMGGPPMGGTMMMDPSMSVPIGAPYGAPYGGMPAYGDPSCAVPGSVMPSGGYAPYGGYSPNAGYYPNDGCCLSSLFGCYDPCQTMCDPCQSYGACPPVCDPCQTSVCPPAGGIYHGAGGAQRCGWAAGYSFVFLKPHYGSNDAFFVTTPSGASTITTNREFDYSLNLSPRVFVEYVSPGDNGFRATWFGFENDSDAVSAVVPVGGLISRPLGFTSVAGDTVTATSEINLDTIDFDLTQRLRVRRSLVNIGGGLRWAGYEHEYLSTVTGAAGTETGNATRQFNGFGPTIFAEWRRPIGMTRFSVLANLRGSMLYGDSKTDSLVESPLGATVFHQENDDLVGIGETQLGGEWSAWLSQRTVLFVQVAWETQYWLGVGTPFDDNDDLGLFGFNTTVGLEW